MGLQPLEHETRLATAVQLSSMIEAADVVMHEDRNTYFGSKDRQWIHGSYVKSAHQSMSKMKLCKISNTLNLPYKEKLEMQKGKMHAIFVSTLCLCFRQSPVVTLGIYNETVLYKIVATQELVVRATRIGLTSLFIHLHATLHLANQICRCYIPKAKLIPQSKESDANYMYAQSLPPDVSDKLQAFIHLHKIYSMYI